MPTLKPPHLSQIPPPQIGNKAFLKGIFGSHYGDVIYTSFDGDPNALGGRWDAKEIKALFSKKQGIRKDWNNYFCVSLFNRVDEGGVTGKVIRRRHEFQACYVLVLDDVAEKIAADKIAIAPSYKLLTSPNSEQWGFIFDQPVTDPDLYDALTHALVGKYFAGKDPGMLGVTRYVRLPVGVNHKPKYGNPPPKCQLTRWRPDAKYSIDELAKAFQIDLAAARQNLGGRVTGLTPQQYAPDFADDPVFLGLDELGMVQTRPKVNGWADVDCPWIDEHSERSKTGAAYRPGGFRCHHSHGEEKTYRDVEKFVVEAVGEGRWRELVNDCAKSDFEKADKDILLTHGFSQEAERRRQLKNVPFADRWTELKKATIKQSVAARIDKIVSPASMPVARSLDKGRRFFVGSVALLFGKPGTGKSTYIMNTACDYVYDLSGDDHVCRGGWHDMGNQIRRAWLVLADDDTLFNDHRLYAYHKRWGLDPMASGGRVLMTSADSPEMGRINLSADGVGAEMIETIRDLGIQFVAIDPLANVSGMTDENIASEMTKIMARVRVVAAKTGAFVFLVHHSRKGASDAKLGDSEMELENARGSGALGGAVRYAEQMAVMSATKADRFGIGDHERKNYVEIAAVKSSYAPEAQTNQWVQKQSVEWATNDPVFTTETAPVMTRWREPVLVLPEDKDLKRFLEMIEHDWNPDVGLFTRSNRGKVSEKRSIFTAANKKLGWVHDVTKLALDHLINEGFLDEKRKAPHGRAASKLGLYPTGKTFHVDAENPNIF